MNAAVIKRPQTYERKLRDETYGFGGFCFRMGQYGASTGRPVIAGEPVSLLSRVKQHGGGPLSIQTGKE
jgi:hypothetical protein